MSAELPPGERWHTLTAPRGSRRSNENSSSSPFHLHRALITAPQPPDWEPCTHSLCLHLWKRSCACAYGCVCLRKAWAVLCTSGKGTRRIRLSWHHSLRRFILPCLCSVVAEQKPKWGRAGELERATLNRSWCSSCYYATLLVRPINLKHSSLV